MLMKLSTVFALLVGLYFLASALSWITERWVPALSGGQGSLRITLRHFHQPDEWGVTPRSLKVFLGRVKDGGSGVFAPDWLYESLLGAYLILNLLFLVRITNEVSTRAERQPGQELGVDYVLRYAPIVDKLSRCPIDARILEVGPWIAGLAKFLDQHTIIGIDNRSLNRRILPQNLKIIQASALSAPFPDSSFDHVVCVDVIEHLAPADRAGLIKESLRVTKDTLFIAVPSGRRAERVERFLYAVLAPFYRIFHKDLSYLREHIQNGLPAREDLLRVINTCAPSAQVSVVGNVNLYVWILCMCLDPLVRRITKHTGIGWLQRLLSPIVHFLTFEPEYRLVLVVSKAEDGKS